MTLFKQMALMLSLFIIIILSTVLTINFNNSKSYVQKALSTDAKNTAYSLSIALANTDGQTTSIAKIIDANFEEGYYKYISLVDNKDNIVHERIAERDYFNIPEWFLDFVSIAPPIASTDIANIQGGIATLYIEGDDYYAYVQLYSILKNFLISFALLAIAGLVMLYFILHILLKPLKRVQQQAEAITKNKFIVQDKIPYTKEFTDVVNGMNSMVIKVKAMFDKANDDLKKHSELEYIDPNTKLRNRKYLIQKLPEYLKIDASSKGGINMMLAFSGMDEANKKIGHAKVDELYTQIAEIFKGHANNYPNSVVARMNGTEFSILIPGCSDKDGLALAKNIYESIHNTFLVYKLDVNKTFVSIGLHKYNYKQTVAQLLSLSDNALAQAKFNELNIHLQESENAVEVMGKEAWRKIINEALESNSFNISPWNVIDTTTKSAKHHVLTISLKSDNGSSYSYGQFMASANQIGLGSKVYQNVINMLFKTPDSRLNTLTCSLRLSYEYLEQYSTYEELSTLFSKYAKKLPFKLIIEMPDKLVSKSSEQIKLYKSLFNKYDIEMGIFEFIGESSDYGYLQEIRPIYIKAEADYFLTHSEQALSALRLISDTVGISLIATSVMDSKTLDLLKDKDIHIVQGKVTEMF